jgi:hypothetical protein
MNWVHRGKPPVRWHWSKWMDNLGSDGYGYVDQTCTVCGRQRRKWYM